MRVLACDLSALTIEQRTRHAVATHRLLSRARRSDLPDGFIFTIDRDEIGVAELAEWVADESRCCPAIDFHVELPASGPLTLKVGGGEEVRDFLAAELGLD